MKDKKIRITILIIVLGLLLSPLILRTGLQDKVFTSEETYLNLLLIDEVGDGSFFEVIVNNNPFHVLLSYINVSDVNLVIFVPLILGLLTLLLVFLLLRRINLSDNESTLVILFFALTPVFLHKFISLNPENLAFPLLLLSVFLYLNKNYFLTIPLILMTFVNPLISIIFGLFVLINYLFFDKTKKKNSIISFIVTLFSLIAYLIINKTLLVRIQGLILDDVFIELGSVSGYSIPLIILSIIGVFTWWEKEKERTIITTSLLMGFVISLFFPQIRLVIALVLALFAGIGMNKLITKEWDLNIIKKASLLLIFCIILFSAILTITTQVTQITKQEVSAAKFLARTNGEGIVLSTEDKGFMIQYLSGKDTLLDGESYSLDKYDGLIFSKNEIFYARKLSSLEEHLQNNNITYLFINEDMKQGKVWTGREEGLLFFLIHSDKFMKIFDNEEVQIYKYASRVE